MHVLIPNRFLQSQSLVAIANTTRLLEHLIYVWNAFFLGRLVAAASNVDVLEVSYF
jgi:hypothetical protein